jgi:hypothetical protein
MPLSKLARYEGEDLPRCPEKSPTGDRNVNPAGMPGRWECTLPDGHEDYDNERVRPHSWVKVD